MNKSHWRRTVVLAAVLLLSVAYVSSAQTPTTQVTPSVTVEDQQIVNGTVTVQNVVAAQDGWMVIHRAADGTFGEVIGHTFVQAGTTENVVVPIDVSQATQTLYAMLHIDEGQEGVYEFPGPDLPAQVNGEIVVEPFTVTNLAQLGVTPGAVTGTPGAVTGTPTATTATPTRTPAQVLPETGQEMTPTPMQVLPETGQEMTPTATPAQVLPETGQVSPTTPWGLILLVPGIVILLVGVSMALVTRRR